MSIIANETCAPAPAAAPVTLPDIERRAKLFADAHAALATEVALLNDKLEAAKREHLADIRRLVDRCAERHSMLRALLELSPELFLKPRTLVLHGIEVGWRKQKGSLRIPDPERTIELIHKLLPRLADTLLRVTETPDKRALADLPCADARRIGVEIIDATDEIVIKPTDSEVDKIVTALLKDATAQES